MRQYSTLYKTDLFFILLFSFFYCITGSELRAQQTYRVLFLGNSYTNVNNLPQLVHDVAASAGDNLIFDSNAPGGYTLLDHSQDLTSKNKIMAGGWDYAVIQGQSQEPVLATNQFNNGAGAVYNLIRQYNPCTVVMPYMTWGRKNGDAANCANHPVVCTYQSMDSALKSRYLYLTAGINGEVSPVSVVWKYLRQNHPSIDLYQSDESHPSAEGSYAAACCFYTSIFKKDPTLITFNFGLNATDAVNIRNAVKTQVFDSLSKWNFKRLPKSVINFQIVPGINQVFFNAFNVGYNQTYLWDFGDGTTASTPGPTHSYSVNGTYTVSLTTTNCDLQGLHTSFADTVISFCTHTPSVSATHSWLCTYDTLWTQAANSYQWYSYNVVLPETLQYVANYSQYGTSGLSVMSSLNGCNELSQPYSKNVKWSGYYFDGLGDPCKGDTVKFAVLHINTLSGLEKILWLKNGALLPTMTNEDTLLITGSGKYECKVIDSASDCPFDTTYFLLKYDCGDLVDVGIKERKQESTWSLFPSPASETITIKYPEFTRREHIQIYNATGRLIRSIALQGLTTKLNIADLPNGLYYIRMENNKQPALKFIKCL